MSKKRPLFLAMEGCAMLSKSINHLAIAAILLFVGSSARSRTQAIAAEGASTIAWQDDVNSALRLSNQTGQPVLLHFYSNNCVPCKMLDAKAFKNPALGQVMAKSVIPVKINYDQHRDIAQHYNITRFPTDLFLHHTGEELYRTVSPQDPADYAKLIDRVAGKNRTWTIAQTDKLHTIQSAKASFDALNAEFESTRFTHPASTKSKTFQTPDNDAPSEPQTNSYCVAPHCVDVQPTPTSEEPAVGGPFHLASQSTELKGNRYQQVANKLAASESQSILKESDQADANRTMASVTMGGVFAEDKTLALEGYCPVSLLTKKAWILGSPSSSVKHRGRLYQCASEEARIDFLQDPDKYSPVLSGYDIVHFLETGELVAGKREFGCEFQGHVFIFMSLANKAHFDAHAFDYAGNLNTKTESGRVANGTSSSVMQR